MRSPTLLLTAALSLALATTAAAQDPKPALAPFATGFSQPIDITHAGDKTGRLFVNEKTGKIIALNADGSRIGTFLDLSALITTDGERGLLGLAFAPDYATSGRFYVNYTNRQGNTTIARYRVSAADPNVADAASGEVLLTVPQPFANHNGGDLAFGPDGLLYVASGDGGSGNDPQANAQDTTNLLGAILRLDVSGATGYVAAGGYPGAAPEVFAAGLRNPFRISFAPGSDTLWIGDVGQNRREEVDIVTTGGAGTNFGWVCYEGSLDNRGVPSAAQSNCRGFSAYEPPVYEYDHVENGNRIRGSVTGGVVYRGTQFPQLRNFYVFADFVTGRGYALKLDGGGGGASESYVVPGFGSQIVGFGESESGEVYVAQISGTISQLISQAPLPVSVTEFTATPQDCGAVVTWTTEREVDLSHYELEVAGEDLRWAAFAKTYPGAPDGRYRQIVDLQGGSRYARLVSVDLDGTRDTGPVIRLEDACAPTLNSYPNPVSRGAEATVTLADARQLVFVSDALGRLVLTLDPGGSARLSLPTASLPAGNYFIRQGSQVARVVVAQ